MRTTSDINKPLLDLLVSLYFGVDDRAWYYEERGSYYYQPSNIHVTALVDLQRRGFIDIVDRTKQNILSHGIGKVKFGVTAKGEDVIKSVFLVDPDRVIKACRSYLMWVPVVVSDTLRYISNEMRTDTSRLPELLVSEVSAIREIAGLILDWVQEKGQVLELADMTSSNLVG